MGVEVIYTDVGGYSFNLSTLGPYSHWASQGPSAALQAVALMPLTEYCLHVLHEVSVHRSPPTEEQQTRVSKCFH